MQEEILHTASEEPVTLFERALQDLGFDYRRLSLKKFKDCVHWHICMPGQTGTLEATYVPDGHRLWLDVRKGREAPWQESAVAELKRLFGGTA